MTDATYRPLSDEDTTLIPSPLDPIDGGDEGLRPDPLAPRPSLRQSVRHDVDEARAWSRDRALAAREAVQAEPMRATLTALAVGVVIGVLLRR